MTALIGLLAGITAMVVAAGILYPRTSAVETASTDTVQVLTEEADEAYAKGVVEIDLSDLSSLDADEVEVEGGVVKIGASGVYTLSGTLDGGSIEVDTKGKVYLEFDGVHITSYSGPALRIKNAKRVTVVLAEESTNSLADTAGGDADGATLSSNDALYFTGPGTLVVTGNNSGGIASDESIVIGNGGLVVNAVGDGLAAGDDITINGGNVTVTANGDGLDSNGTVHITGGRLVAFGGTTLGEGGIDASGDVTITGGTVIVGGSLLAVLGEDSRQTTVYVTSAAISAAGTTISLERDGEEVFSYTPSVAFQNVLISSGDLTSGVMYRAHLGGKIGNLVTASR